MTDIIITANHRVFCKENHMECTLWMESHERCKDCPLNSFINYLRYHILPWEETGPFTQWKRGGTVVPPSDLATNPT